MVGSLLIYPPNVAVETTSVWNTLYPVQREDSQPLDTMRYEISLPPCSLKFAKKYALNPKLQPVTPDQLNGASANRQDGARLDVSANGVWGGRFQKTYFDVRVFNPLAPSNQSQTPAATFRKHELEKKRAYQQRVQDIEHSSFTPLVLSVTGGMGVEATTFYKRLAALLSQKWDSPYSKTLC